MPYYIWGIWDQKSKVTDDVKRKTNILIILNDKERDYLMVSSKLKLYSCNINRLIIRQKGREDNTWGFGRSWNRVNLSKD